MGSKNIVKQTKDTDSDRWSKIILENYKILILIWEFKIKVRRHAHLKFSNRSNIHWIIILSIIKIRYNAINIMYFLKTN